MFKTLGNKISGWMNKHVVKPIKNKATSIKNAFVQPFKSAYDKIDGWISKIKKAVNNLKLKLPLKIPSVSVSGGKAP